jgi:DNA-binding Xre family transcriptional regulator
MLSLNLDYIFRVRGIEKPFTFLTRAGFTHYTASHLLNNKAKHIKLKHIELLCTALLCEPHDLLKWTPDKNKVYPENLPLRNLIKDEIGDNWRKKLESKSLKEMEELTKRIMSDKKSE